MVRANQPLVERMALIFHDWFATSNDKVGNARLMIDQTDLFRSRRLRQLPNPARERHRRTRR